ncbi:MAG: hypothetical protein Q7R90_03945 [bacterium]|nr:hypothetical protein [bacterium]
MAARIQLLFVTLAVCAFALAALPAHAQFGLSDPGSALSILFTPATPHPGETVTVSVRSSLLDIRGSDILWEANGKKIAQGKDASFASVTAGGLGEETTVAVTVVAQDGTSARAEAVIIPTELDLLVDSDSYTPPFYRGAPRPSAGTTLRLQTFPRFKRGSTLIPAGELIYTWRRGGEVIGSISGRGRLVAVIPVEHIFGVDLISVEVRSADDRLAQMSSVSVAAQEPVLALYEDHPLYGVLYHRALSNTASVSGAEATFAAIPFFAQARNIYDPALQFDWRVNSAEIPANLKNPGELTINAENSSGVAFIELGVTHATNFFLDAKGAWNVTFSSPWGGTSDQFRQSNSVTQ